MNKSPYGYQDNTCGFTKISEKLYSMRCFKVKLIYSLVRFYESTFECKIYSKRFLVEI